MDVPTVIGSKSRVAVVTVSYGSGSAIKGLVATLDRASSEPWLFVVADNRAAESDNVADLAKASRARYVAMQGNVGYGSAINAVVRTLPENVEWVLVANPDLLLAPGSLDVLLATGDSDPAIASVGPTTLTSDGQLYPSARMVPSLRTGVGHALFANLWLENPWSRKYRNDVTEYNVRRDAGWLSGACLLVRRSAFSGIGGFDEGYFMYFEDVDLGYRFTRGGYRNVFEPEAIVTHAGGHSTHSDAEAVRMVVAHHASARRFLNKKYSSPVLLPLRVALGIGLAARSAVMRHQIRRAASR